MLNGALYLVGLLVPMKLGLKNIKAVTEIAYTRASRPTTGTSAATPSTTVYRPTRPEERSSAPRSSSFPESRAAQIGRLSLSASAEASFG